MLADSSFPSAAYVLWGTAASAQSVHCHYKTTQQQSFADCLTKAATTKPSSRNRQTPVTIYEDPAADQFVAACMQDEATVRELAAPDVTRDVKGWLQRIHAGLFKVDLFASVPSNDTLMRIHTTAEEFEATAEKFLAPFVH